MFLITANLKQKDEGKKFFCKNYLLFISTPNSVAQPAVLYLT